MINKATLLGRLGRDPEIKATPSGMQVAEFSIATEERRKKGDKWESETEWHNVVAFGKTAENVARFAGKGLRIYVEGPIKYETWDKKDGSGKGHRTKILANFVKFVDFKKADEYDQRATEGEVRAQGPADDDDTIPF